MEFHVKKSQGSTFLPNTSADFPDSPGSESLPLRGKSQSSIRRRADFMSKFTTEGRP